MAPEELQKKAEERHEERQERREEIRDERRDHYREQLRREEVGTTYYESDYFDDDYCEASVVVDGITYYGCEGVWYRRAYAGGSVTYVVVDGPGSE